jgi:hypothetical protein
MGRWPCLQPTGRNDDLQGGAVQQGKCFRSGFRSETVARWDRQAVPGRFVHCCCGELLMQYLHIRSGDGPSPQVQRHRGELFHFLQQLNSSSPRVRKEWRNQIKYPRIWHRFKEPIVSANRSIYHFLLCEVLVQTPIMNLSRQPDHRQGAPLVLTCRRGERFAYPLVSLHPRYYCQTRWCHCRM